MAPLGCTLRGGRSVSALVVHAAHSPQSVRRTRNRVSQEQSWSVKGPRRDYSSSSTRRTTASRFSLALQVGQGPQSMRRVRFLKRRITSGTLADLCPARDLETVMDGRRSFPSGHSSTAFSGMMFLSLWVAGITGAWCITRPATARNFLASRLARLGLSFLPLFFATWVAISRLEDYVRVRALRVPLCCLTPCGRDTTRRTSLWAASSGSPAR